MSEIIPLPGHVKEYQEHEERLQRAREEALKDLLDMRDLFKATSEPREIDFPEYGFKVSVCELNYNELTQLSEIPSMAERNKKEFLIRVSKAGPRWTPEIIEELPGYILTAVLLKCNKENNRFLLQEIASGLNISNKTPEAITFGESVGDSESSQVS